LETLILLIWIGMKYIEIMEVQVVPYLRNITIMLTEILALQMELMEVLMQELVVGKHTRHSLKIILIGTLVQGKLLE